MVSLHDTRSVREIAAQARTSPHDDLNLDSANDAWIIRRTSCVAVRRQGFSHIIGNVAHLHGAARYAAACRMVNQYRGRV